MLQSSVHTSVESNASARSCDCLVHRFGNAADQPDRAPCYRSDKTEAEWQVVGLPCLCRPGWRAGEAGRRATATAS
ncbi:hypothetical protein GCM10009680_56000 [Streptomyces yatensis]|uniref:Uncharacterized protein n=1 Tax=Streptomyces yatensis TaxID=155177 RepID=A0ABN2IMI6_9ACTN